MIKEEEKVKEFKKACEEAERTGKNVMMISGSEGNVKCMKGCMEDTVKVINFLHDKENWKNIEPWQLEGAEAILGKCWEDGGYLLISRGCLWRHSACEKN